MLYIPVTCCTPTGGAEPTEDTSVSGGRCSCCTCERHVLLVGAGDLRHLLKTLSSSTAATHVGRESQYANTALSFEVAMTALSFKVAMTA